MYTGSLLPLTTYTIDDDSDEKRMVDNDCYDDDGMIMIIVMFVM